MMKHLIRNFSNTSTSFNENSSPNVVNNRNGSLSSNNKNNYKLNNNYYLNGNINLNANDENLSLINNNNNNGNNVNNDSIIDMELETINNNESTSILNNPGVSTNTVTATVVGDSSLQSTTDSLSFKSVLNKSMTKGSKAMRMLGNNINTSNDYKSVAFSKTTSLTRAISSKRAPQKRLFFKNGNINISRCNIDKRRRRYLTDIFTTLIDIKWRYNVLVFAAGFFVSWTVFAVAWYLISYIHGDLLPENLNNTSTHTPCIQGVESFAGAILFSIETQQTIGYGVRYTTEKCPEAILVMMIQSSVGVMIQSFMVGVVFAKLSRPKKRSETLMFSKNACINLRDGRLCLLCRVADMRKSHIVEAHVRMYLIKKKVTSEGEIIPLHMYDLNIGWDKGLDRLFLVWPLTVEHYIDENSPFWNLSAMDLKSEHFELAVILEGVVESTGMTTQARTSYLPDEILWGHRFEKLITFQKEDGTYKIDYSRFNSLIPVDTPLCSAKELKDLQEEEKNFSLNEEKIYNGLSVELRKRKLKKINPNNIDDIKTRDYSTPEIVLPNHEHNKIIAKNNLIGLIDSNKNTNSEPIFDTGKNRISFYKSIQNGGESQL